MNFLNFFRKKDKTEKINFIQDEINLIKKYNFKNFCNQCIYNNAGKCNNECLNWKNTFEKGKKNFLIIDDNKGIVSIIRSLINDLGNEGRIDLSKWNILSFEGKQAGVFLLKFLMDNEVSQIDSALIDITFGNILRIFKKNIKINGIHIAYFLKQKFPNLKFYFYTGNTLNEYIKHQKMMKDFFKDNFGEKIESYIIRKMLISDEEMKLKLEELLKD